MIIKGLDDKILDVSSNINQLYTIYKGNTLRSAAAEKVKLKIITLLNKSIYACLDVDNSIPLALSSTFTSANSINLQTQALSFLQKICNVNQPEKLIPFAHSMIETFHLGLNNESVNNEIKEYIYFILETLCRKLPSILWNESSLILMLWKKYENVLIYIKLFIFNYLLFIFI